MPSITPSFTNYGAGELPTMPGALSWDGKHETRAGFSSTMDSLQPSQIAYFPIVKNHVPLELFQKIAAQLPLKDVWKLGSVSRGHAAGIKSLIEVAAGVNTLKNFLAAASASPENINEIFAHIFEHLPSAACSSRQRTEVLTVLGKATSLLSCEAIKKNNTLLMEELEKNCGEMDKEKVDLLKTKLEKLIASTNWLRECYAELNELKKSGADSSQFRHMEEKVDREYNRSWALDIFSFNKEAGIKYWPPIGALLNAISNVKPQDRRSVLPDKDSIMGWLGRF